MSREDPRTGDRTNGETEAADASMIYLKDTRAFSNVSKSYAQCLHPAFPGP
jgi:hypothetical protein